MYPRRNRSARNGNNQQPDPDLSADIEAEDIRGGAGNEAALLGNILAGAISAANADDDDALPHYAGNDLNRLDGGRDNARPQAKKEGLDHFYEDDLNRLEAAEIMPVRRQIKKAWIIIMKVI